MRSDAGVSNLAGQNPLKRMNPYEWHTYPEPCMMLSEIWHHFYNLKNVKNTHEGALLLEGMQALVSHVNGLLEWPLAVRSVILKWCSFSSEF